ncbi:FecR domain-containing protein [Cupriavidus plantarum]|uniref:FecR domain-containing protein n=1 Tax=Cupriavidus plantarum TaxID=942865 RepID=UPI00339D75FE
MPNNSGAGRALVGTVLLLVFGMRVALAGPAGSENGSFVHVVESGETLAGLSARYTGKSSGWRQLQRLNAIGDPFRLQPGTRVRIPLSWIATRAGSATIVSVAGTVYVNRERAKEGMVVAEAAEVSTGADGYATFQLGDGTRVVLPPNTVLEVRRLRAFVNVPLQDTLLRLREGAADAEVAPAETGVGRFEIETPLMITGVRGTRYEVEASPARESSVVLSGAVDVRTRRETLNLRMGFGTNIDTRGRLSRAAPLRGSPVLQTLPGRVYSSEVDIEWQPQDGISEWRVVASRDPARTQVVRVTTAREPRARLLALPAGQLYLSVRPVDARGIVGFPATAPIYVKLDPPAPIVISPSPNSHQYGDSASLQWTSVASAKRYELEVSRDQQFKHVDMRKETRELTREVQLAAGLWWWRMRSYDADGEPGPWSAPVPFEMSHAVPQAAMTRDDGRKLQLTWGPTALDANAREYRFQLAADEGFHDIVTDMHTENGSVTMDRPSPGMYWVRIARIEADNSQSPFSVPQTVTLPALLRDAHGAPVGSTFSTVRHGG